MILIVNISTKQLHFEILEFVLSAKMKRVYMQSLILLCEFFFMKSLHFDIRLKSKTSLDKYSISKLIEFISCYPFICFLILF